MNDINLVRLRWEKSLPCEGKGHVQRPWGGSQQYVFSRNRQVSEAENKEELEAGTRGLEVECGTE